jgi:hypothetical protein
MKNVIVLLIALVFIGCGRQAPEHFSIDEGFSESEAATIRAAVDAWCEAAGWCPSEVGRAERGRFSLVDHLEMDEGDSCPEGLDCIVGGRNDGDNIRIASDFIAKEGLDVLFTIAAHEVGHFCTEHTETGLMAAKHRAEDGAAVVDAVAVEAWNDGCH